VRTQLNETITKTTSYTVARCDVGAYGFLGCGRAGRVVHFGAELHRRRLVSMRARHARWRTRSQLFTRACQRAVGWLFDDFVEGLLDGQRMRSRHQGILPPRHVRQHIQPLEAASRRSQRKLQGSAGVHGLSRGQSEFEASSALKVWVLVEGQEDLQSTCRAPDLPGAGSLPIRLNAPPRPFRTRRLGLERAAQSGRPL
jgi:hypothetical protein